MKPINIAPFLLALCLLASCSSGDDEPEVIVPQDATLTLSVAPGSVLTKSSLRDSNTDDANLGEMQKGEATIHNICAALFKEDGSLLTSSYVDYNSGENNTPDTIRISGKSITKYTYVILVNVGNKSFTSLDRLKEETFALKDIRVDNQPMCSQFRNVELKPGANYIGSKEVFTNAPADATFLNESSVKVYRTASRIDFEQIGVKWSDSDAADLIKANARFRLKRVYATQVKSHTYLSDRDLNNHSVELKDGVAGLTYLHGKESATGYLETLNLFDPAEETDQVVISNNSSFGSAGINGGNPWRCYVTENTEEGLKLPTTLILQGDILPESGEEPILKGRYFFVRLKDMKDTQGNVLPGVIRNYVIRISATISGKGSGDEEYRENASAIVTVTPDDWSVEETQHEGVN